jgi:putative multicomponent Na+:H+ antiporter subunit B
MDSYVYAITALLPLAAAMVVFQTNPYHALVIRGILGAVAALAYTVLGAADVALTEALVGTLLAITLYAIAVRSSLVLHLGVLKAEIEADGDISDSQTSHFQQLMQELRRVFGKHHVRVELVPYLNHSDLHQALMDKEVHVTCLRSHAQDLDTTLPKDQPQPYHTTTRLRRLYEILQTELVSSTTQVNFVSPPEPQEAHG